MPFPYDLAVSDPDALTWQRNVTAAGSNSGKSFLAVSRFIQRLKDFDLYPLIDRANVFAGADLTAALIPCVAKLGNASDTNVNFTGASYNENSGLSSDASGTQYLKTGAIPTVANYGVSAYLINAPISGALTTIIGARNNGSGNCTELGRGTSAGNRLRGCVNMGGATAYATSGSMLTSGLMSINRLGATSTILSNNGVQLATAADAFTTIPPFDLWVFSRNNSNASSNPLMNATMSGYVFHSGLTVGQLLMLQQAFGEFNMLLGRV